MGSSDESPEEDQEEGGLMLHDAQLGENVTLHLCVPVFCKSDLVSLAVLFLNIKKEGYICLMDIIRSPEWMIRSAAKRMIQCL